MSSTHSNPGRSAAANAPLLLVDCYLDDPGARPTFEPLLGAHLRVARVTRSQPCPPLDGVAGVVISGSAASITDPPPWVAGVEDLVRRSADARVPLLGVCYGHQLIARALFGADTVRLTPTPELGWIEVCCTAEAAGDPLWSGIDARFEVFASHVEEVHRLPHQAIIQASSFACAVHGFRVEGLPMWGVQFHSEMTVTEATELVRTKAQRYPERGIDAEAVIARARDHRELARTLFDNFAGVARRGGTT